MKLNISQISYKKIWLKLIVEFKLNLHLTSREYDVLELLFKYSEKTGIVDAKNKIKLSDELDISIYYLNNILKRLKDLNLINKDTNKPLFPMISYEQILKQGIVLNFNEI